MFLGVVRLRLYLNLIELCVDYA